MSFNWSLFVPNAFTIPLHLPVGSPGREVEQISALAGAGEKMIDRLRRKAFLPERRKSLNIRFGIAEAAALLGCSTNRIRMAEEDGRLPPAPASESGRRAGDDIPALLRMRAVLGAFPARADTDRPAIIAVQNFKGGVGKSTIKSWPGEFGQGVKWIFCLNVAMVPPVRRRDDDETDPPEP